MKDIRDDRYLRILHGEEKHEEEIKYIKNQLLVEKS